MRQIVITKAGPPSVLKIEEKPDPEPVGDQVRIRVKASGVNFADILARKGLYPDAPPIPSVVGYEVSGVVDKIGPQGDKSLLNKKVIGITKFGGYSDVVCVAAHHVFPFPDSLTFAEAASLPVNNITAYQLIYHMGGLRAGQTVLIQNAGGGVGLAAIDIAKHIGAISIGTASGRKHDFLKSRGLDHCIDYRTEDVTKRVKEITNDYGVDLIIDPIGGQEVWLENYNLLAPGGRLGMFGASSFSDAAEMNIISKIYTLASFFLTIPKWGPLELMDKNRAVFGVNVAHLMEDPYPVKWFKEIIDGVSSGSVRPYVDSVFTFDDAAKAHEYIESRKNTGKVILVPTTADIEPIKK